MEKLQRLQEEGRLQTAVIWLGLDGEPETPVEGLPPGTRVVVLPRKARTPEEWAERVRQRWSQDGKGQL